MNSVGRTLLFNRETGNLIIDLGEQLDGTREDFTAEDIIIVQLEYGEKADEFKNMLKLQLDIDTRELIFTQRPKESSLEEYIQDLENQILLLEDEKVGGIL